MSRRTTKAEKIASYDALARHKDAAGLLHYLMTFKPSSPSNATLVAREEDRDGEMACVRAQCFGLDRADGGVMLLSAWTEPVGGGIVGEAVLFAGYVLDQPDGGEHYYATAMGRAMRECARLVRVATREACGVRA